MIRKSILVLCMALLAAATASADNKEQKRLENSGAVMQEIMNVPDNIPQQVMEKAECVIVFPSVLKAAFVVGASYGRGAMVCRTGKDYRGPWGAPSMFAMEGGSFGFQIGVDATDFVFLVMDNRGADSLIHSKVKLGADATAAAGPKGREAEADTDVTMRAEILTYSRARGVFAGVSLEGSTLRPDNDGNKHLYGEKVDAETIITERSVHAPEAATGLISTLQKASPQRKS